MDNMYDNDIMPFYSDDEMENIGEYQIELSVLQCPYFGYCENLTRKTNMKKNPPPPPGQQPPHMPNFPPGQPPHMPNFPSAPQGPPPGYIPEKKKHAPGGPAPKAVEPGSIRFCRYKYTYIWQTNGRSYWAYITFIGRRSIAGYRWIVNRWVYFGIDLRRIESFICY